MKTFMSIKRFIRAMWNTIELLLGVKGEYRNEAEENGICYYGGQK
jgi:hypothetical protein